MTALAAFTFLRPRVLLALPVLAGLWLLLRRRPASGRRRPRTIAPHLLAALTIGREGRSRVGAPDLLIPAAMLMALAAAGPAWRPAPSPFVSETAPVVIALDLSPTMSSPTSPPPVSSGPSRRSATSSRFVPAGASRSSSMPAPPTSSCR